MKRTIALVLAFILCLGLFAGCKKKQAAAPAASGIAGKAQTVGQFTVFVPDGWNLIADQTRSDQVYICKGSSDISNSTYVKLTGNGVLPAEGTCTDMQALEARTYGNFSWSGFSGNKPGGHAIYLITQAESGTILATLWYTDETGSISPEDPAVQAILADVSYTVPTEPTPSEPAPVPDAPTSIAGDWSGSLEFMDCNGDYENRNGAVYSCIARILVDDAGNVTPYIGVAQDGGTITGLSSTPIADEMAPTISGAWQGIAFSDVAIGLESGKLCITISISTESGNALLQLTMLPLTDGSFETQATQLGCTGYPTN